jgi:predicted phosphodiesterase
MLQATVSRFLCSSACSHCLPLLSALLSCTNTFRVLIVGDIHGCCDEFRKLIAQYWRKDDVLILAGDLVNKGPKSVEVVRLARELGALGVCGNHELASLRGYADRQRFPDWARADRSPRYTHTHTHTCTQTHTRTNTHTNTHTHTHTHDTRHTPVDTNGRTSFQ